MTEKMLVTYPENLQQQIKNTLNWQSEPNKKELTKKEVEVLYFMSFGWNDEETSNALKIKPNTYHTHRRNILNKLNASNKIQAVATAFRCGLLSC